MNRHSEVATVLDTTNVSVTRQVRIGPMAALRVWSLRRISSQPHNVARRTHREAMWKLRSWSGSIKSARAIAMALCCSNNAELGSDAGRASCRRRPNRLCESPDRELQEFKSVSFVPRAPLGSGHEAAPLACRQWRPPRTSALLHLGLSAGGSGPLQERPRAKRYLVRSSGLTY
jgi:hypothetical protein